MLQIDFVFVLIESAPVARLNVEPCSEPKDNLLKRLADPEPLRLSVPCGEKELPERPLPERHILPQAPNKRIPLPQGAREAQRQDKPPGKSRSTAQGHQSTTQSVATTKQTPRAQAKSDSSTSSSSRQARRQLPIAQAFRLQAAKLKLDMARSFRLMQRADARSMNAKTLQTPQEQGSPTLTSRAPSESPTREESAKPNQGSGLSEDAQYSTQAKSKAKLPAQCQQAKPNEPAAKESGSRGPQHLATKSQLAAGRHLFSQRQANTQTRAHRLEQLGSKSATQTPGTRAKLPPTKAPSLPPTRAIAARSATRGPHKTAAAPRSLPGLGVSRTALGSSAGRQGQAARALPAARAQMATPRPGQTLTSSVRQAGASPIEPQSATKANVNTNAARPEAPQRQANEPGDDARHNRVEAFRRVRPELDQAQINLLAQQFLSDELASAIAMAGLRPGTLFIDSLPVLRLDDHLYSLYIAIDLVTRYAHISLVRGANPEKSAAFLQDALDLFPFRVHEIVTANNPVLHATTQKEGRSLFLEACSRAQLRFRLMNPGAVLMRGLIRLYDGIQPELAQAIRKRCGAVKALLEDYLSSYNHLLTQKDLNYKTPWQIATSWYAS